MRKAIIYTRVSTAEQAEGTSLDFQEQRLRDLCENEGTVVVRVFVEPGVSAKTKDKRPQLLEALRVAKRELGPGDYFMTYDISRFTRNHYEGLGMMFELQNKGVFFRDADRVFTDSPEDRFLFTIHSGLAQLDNEVKARATRQRMAALAKAGEWQHSAPFGYRKGDRSKGEDCLVEISGEAQVIRFIMESLGRGETASVVAASLDDYEAFISRMGPAKGNRNLKFVLRVATNLIYTARQLTKLTEVVVDGNWVPLVSRELYEEVQNIISGRPRVSTPISDPFWLKPVLVCGSCGGKFTGEAVKKRRYHYYRCFHCRKESLPMEVAHRQLTELLGHLRLPGDVITCIKKDLNEAVGAENRTLEEQRIELERAISKDNTRLEALEDELLSPRNPGLDRTRLADRVKILQSELATRQTRLAEVSSVEGIDIEEALRVLDEILIDPKAVFERLEDVDKASFLFVLLPEKVICKDKRLQTTGLLVPASVSDPLSSSDPTWHPQRSPPS